MLNGLSDERFGGDFNVAQTDVIKKDKQPEIRSSSLWHEHFFYKPNDPRLEGKFNVK